MSTYATIDADLWRSVRRRRTPDRWVVLVALAIAVLVIVGAAVARSRGMTDPRLQMTGLTGEWDASTSTTTYRMTLNNLGAVPITVQSVRMVGPTGQPQPGVVSVEVDPVVVPPLEIPGAVQGPDTTTTLRIRVDCAATVATAGFDRAPQLIAETTGTWPTHTVDIGELGSGGSGFCRDAA